MGTLNLIERDSILRPLKALGFWQRQFAPSVTKGQIVFDIIFGAVAPILCFVFDPIVFRGGMFEPPLWPEYQVFAYLFSGLLIALLCLWLLSAPGFGFVRDLIGGALMSGVMFCLAIGIVLSPFSAMGLMLGIGIFGFTPFLTALVYLRNGYRALRTQRNRALDLSRVLTLLIGLLLASAAPALLSVAIHQAVTKSISEIVQGDSEHALRAARRLMPLRFFAEADLDQIVQAYIAESDPTKKQVLKNCYHEVTGGDIDERVNILQD